MGICYDGSTLTCWLYDIKSPFYFSTSGFLSKINGMEKFLSFGYWNSSSILILIIKDYVSEFQTESVAQRSFWSGSRLRRNISGILCLSGNKTSGGLMPGSSVTRLGLGGKPPGFDLFANIQLDVLMLQIPMFATRLQKCVLQ